MITAVSPSGDMTIGNYLAVVKKIVEYQNDYDLKVFIANLHAITIPQEPEQLHERIKKMAALYFACGLDPEKATVFLQSEVNEHAMLGWLLNTQENVGELERMTQYKDKAQRQKAKNGTNFIPAGLLNYPVLMAADILIYDIDLVPVGQDQIQHVELARNLAEKMNKRFGNGEQLFAMPEALVNKEVLKIMDLQVPTKKMSKSSDNDKSIIKVLDEPELIRKKIASAITDSENIIRYDQENKPGVSNLMLILKTLTGKSFETIEQEFTGKNYKDLKDAVTDALLAELTPIQERYKKLYNSPEVENWLKQGADKARKEAAPKVQLILERMGLSY